MLTQEEIRDKLYESAEQFEDAYYARQYARAKNIYDTAEKVALFVELEPKDRNKLFMNQADEDAELPAWGAMSRMSPMMVSFSILTAMKMTSSFFSQVIITAEGEKDKRNFFDFPGKMEESVLRGQILFRRVVQPGAVFGESGAVAWAVPAVLLRIPFQGAAQMGAPPGGGGQQIFRGFLEV